MKYGGSARRRPECGVERTLDVIGGRWTTLILRELLGGTRRFSELSRALGRISPKTLTARLRELETQGIVTRTVYPVVPPRVEYTLTRRGEGLGEIIAAMARWGSAQEPNEQPHGQPDGQPDAVRPAETSPAGGAEGVLPYLHDRRRPAPSGP